MILSVSRRTDIPNYYADWFYNRIKEGFLYVRNPMNAHQVSRINLSPEVVDCIVFWTKNPEPMMERLVELSAYSYYFQFTLTGYGRDIEGGVPHKKEEMIPVFQKLSEQIGSNKVIWRYDPILFTKTYTPAYHLKAFAQIAEALRGYTDQCVISFVDEYAKNRKSMASLGAYELDEAELFDFAGKLHEIAEVNQMRIATCAEKLDLQECGIEHNCCVDKNRIEEIIGYRLKVGKDKNQRAECVRANMRHYDPMSPLLCGDILPGDKITDRKVSTHIENTLCDGFGWDAVKYP